MQDRLLGLIATLAYRHGRKILAVSGLLTVAALAVSFNPKAGIVISTSQKALLPAKHPVQKDYRAFVEEFGALDSLVVVLEGEPATLRSASEYFAAEFRKERTWLSNVFYKVDLDFFKNRVPLYVPADTLRSMTEALEKQQTIIARIGTLTDLEKVLAELEAGFGAPALDLHPDSVSNLLKGIAQLFAEWRRWVADPTRHQIDLLDSLPSSGREMNPVVKSGGYLTSRDGKLLFLFLQPSSSSDERKYLRPLVDAMRQAADRVYAAHPELKSQVKVAFTGLPAHVLTETDTVFNDVGTGTVGSILLVVLIVFVGFRTPRKIAIAVIPLVVGMSISLGAITLLVGRLNLVSAAFFAVMFGMSIDFGIYLVRRAEEELGAGADLPRAVHTAMVQTGRGVLAGGLTTCAAFFAITFSEFSGFAELGLTAGTGIFLCLVAVFLLVPSLMFQLGLEPRRPDLARVVSVASGERARKAIWVMLALVAVVGVAALHAARGTSFDYNALHLLPRDTESTVYQLRMQEESDFQVSTTAVVADDLDQIRALAARIRALPDVSRVESLADLIPEDQTEKLQQIARIRPLLKALKVVYVPEKVGLDGFLKRLDKVADKFSEAQEAAFSGGRSDLVELLEKVQTEIRQLKGALAGADAQLALTRTRAFERELFQTAQQGVALVHAWVDSAQPVSESQLAPEILARFKSPKGHYVAYVFPKHSVWDVDALDRFVGHLQEITPRVTGFPVTHRIYSRMVVRGFYQSMVYAFLALVLLLTLDFKRAHAVILALVPLGLSLLLLQLVLKATGNTYNYASVAGYPVLLGYGVAYGVNIVQRWMEDPSQTAFVSAFTIGKGVVLSAGTTIAGLFSVVFARHRGVATFGAILLYGICLCLVMAVFVLPAIIDLIYFKKGARHGPS